VSDAPSVRNPAQGGVSMLQQGQDFRLTSPGFSGDPMGVSLSDRWTRFETRAAGRLRKRSRMRARNSSARSRSSDEANGSDRTRVRQPAVAKIAVSTLAPADRASRDPAHPLANRTFTRIATSRSSGEALLSRRSQRRHPPFHGGALWCRKRLLEPSTGSGRDVGDRSWGQVHEARSDSRTLSGQEKRPFAGLL
jgi:hypothetical protein